MAQSESNCSQRRIDHDEQQTDTIWTDHRGDLNELWILVLGVSKPNIRKRHKPHV